MPRVPSVDFTIPIDASTLKGKSVLITGGASGIGLACVKTMASHGALITIADLQEEAGNAVVKDLTSQGFQVQFVKCDVTSYESQFSVFKSAIQFGGGSIDIVIPNAGIISQQNLYDMAISTPPSLDSPPPTPGLSGIEVNLNGVYYSCYLAMHYFQLPPRANSPPFKKAIVLIASAAGYLGYPTSTTYSMSKFGVRGILYGLRDRALEAGIRVNLVAPWYIETPMTTETDDAALLAGTKLYGFAPMEGVVDAVVRMSADEGVAGRSAVVMPQGVWDIGDTVHEGYGGVLMKERVGELVKSVVERMGRDP
ncbi:NAD(P)-binding protein [Sporormia fimetaria CBS 119925]|uniref:NAD(P)-binding protein n=1 Tax=Sporormia fimetaria CBS 119925 TaxID=1340428 RepID=A0A6A6UX25_9PLEO|nr:NAD(P)-binding protein [Sporormia fimetaria CBS 119925]